VLSNQADVKSGTDEAAASFMRARRPVFGIAYRMLGSASEASEKPAALQSTLCDLLWEAWFLLFNCQLVTAHFRHDLSPTSAPAQC
jgi:hypothetical protein